jgi:hypothetical protein
MGKKAVLVAQTAYSVYTQKYLSAPAEKRYNPKNNPQTKGAPMPRAILLTLLLLTAPFNALAGPYDVPSTIPDTGQTKCYDTGGNEIDCTGTGQDGEYSINPMSYTKLDSEGNELPHSAESWAMVRDNVTGLIWEVKTNKDGIADYNDPHDADNIYTWYDPNSGCLGTDSQTDTFDFISSLNTGNFGGKNDWRLPSVRELQSIVNYSIAPPSGPTINTIFFPHTIDFSDYWSSTHSIWCDLNEAWTINFFLGQTASLSNTGNSRYVRAVRGGQPAFTIRFVDNKNGTITDLLTGMIWEQKTDEGGPRDKDNVYTWQEAVDYCNDLYLANETDWRLPSVKELFALIDLNPSSVITYSNPMGINIAPVFRNHTVSSNYWTSTTYANNPESAWRTKFSSGDSWPAGKSYSFHVRAVRGGYGTPGNSIVESIRFEPFFPEDTEPSQVMEGGRAIRWYRIRASASNTPISSRILHYRLSNNDINVSDFKGIAYIDDFGFVGILTPKIFFSGRYDLIVTDHHFEPLNVEIFNVPSFQVLISPRTFSESYSCLLGAGVEIGKGPGAKVGPVEFKTIEAGLHGQRNVSTRFVLESNGDQADMAVVNTVDTAIGAEVFAGISGGIFKEHVDKNGRPKLEAGAGASAEISNAMSVRHRFENYTDVDRSDADQQLLALSCLFYENLIRMNPGMANNILVQKLLELFIDKVSGLNNYYEALGFESGVQIQGSVGADFSYKNPFGLSKGSSLEVAVKAFDAEFVYERTEEEDKDGYDTSTQAVIADLEIGSLKAGLSQKFAGDKRRNDTPSFNLDLLGASLYNIAGENSLSFSNGPDHNTMIFKTLIDREGAQSFFLSSEMKERFLELIAADDAAISSIANRSDIARQMSSGDNFEISPAAYNRVFDAFVDIDQGGATWRVTENDIELISFSIEFSLGLGLNFDFELGKVESYKTREGLIIPGKGMFPTELYERDAVIEANIKGFQAVIKPFKEKIEELVGKALETVDGIIEMADELIVEMPARAVSAGGAAVKAGAGALADGVKVRISRWFDDGRRSYRIVAGQRSTGETTEAATVSDVFIVGVENPDGTLMTEFPEPLDLTIRFTETDLAAAGYTLADSDLLRIFRWNPDDHYYAFVGGSLDAANLQMSTPIDRPGQYVLAIDLGAPRIVDFKISGGSSTPQISFSVQDELSGLDTELFTVMLDTAIVVDFSNFTNYLDMATGLFIWKVDTPLAEGDHQLSVFVTDTTGNSEAYRFDFTVDATPPIINHEPVTFTDAGLPLRIQAAVADDNALSAVLLLYRPLLNELPPYQIKRMDSIEDTTSYAADIPSAYLVGSGVEYYLRAIDAAGNESTTTATYIAVRDLVGPSLEGAIETKVTADGLKLIWKSVEDADIAGYRIYSGSAPDAMELYEEINQLPYVLIPETMTGSYISVASFDVYGNEGQRTIPIRLDPCFPGDVDCSNEINLSDAITAFKILTGIALANPPAQIADINGDNLIGLAEAINALQIAAGIR